MSESRSSRQMRWDRDPDWTERVGDDRFVAHGGNAHVETGGISGEFCADYEDDMEINAGVGAGGDSVFATLSAETDDAELGVGAALSPEQARKMAWDLLQASIHVDGSGGDER